MSAGTIVAIIVVVIVVAAVLAAVSIGARRRRLRQRFGPEYDRAVENSDSRRKAEAQLAEREKRVKQLDIRPLGVAARDGYVTQWTRIQEQFVDDPTGAVTAAHSLITDVMNARGYPTEDSAQIIADLSVEHASTLDHYRTAQDLSSRAAGGMASTEDLRQAMVHYRTLFTELLGEPAEGAGTTGNGVTQRAEAEPIVAQPTVADPTVVPPEGDEPELVFPDPGPRDAGELRAAAEQQAAASPASTERTDTTPAGTGASDTGASDTGASEPVTTSTAPATTGSAPAVGTQQSAAEQADETSAAASGRLPRRR